MQYPDFNALKEMFDGQLEIVGVPCTQFLNQEPAWSGEELLNGIKYARPGGGFVPNFPMFAKTEVNGANKHPLFGWFASRCPPANHDFMSPTGYLLYEPKSAHDVRWNWEKFLIDKTGQVYRRYGSPVSPLDIAEDIETMLNK